MPPTHSSPRQPPPANATSAAPGERALIILCGLLAAAFLFVGFAWTRRDPRGALVHAYEDGWLEWLQCLLLLAAEMALLCAIWTARVLPADLRPARRLFLLAAIVIGLAMAEEVSWGQRLFSFDAPASLAALNRQGEVNLHNLAILHPVRHYLQALPFAALLLITLWPLHAQRAWLRVILPSRGIAALAAITLVPYASYFVWPGILGPGSDDLHEHWRPRLLTEMGETLGYWTALIYCVLLLLRVRAMRHACTP